VPPPEKNFLDLKVKIAYFCGLCAKFRFFYDHNSIDLHAIKSVIQGVYTFKFLEQSPRTQGEAPQASRGGKWGESIPLPSRLETLGERHELPQRSPGRSPGRFGAF